MKLYDIQGWRVPSQAEKNKKLKILKKDKNTKISIAEFALNLSGFDLYSYLKARFGAPNAKIMESKNTENPNRLELWGYEIFDNDYHVMIFGMRSYVQIFYAGESSFKNSDWVSFLWDLKNDFKNYKKEITDIKKSYGSWELIYNPYRRVDHQIIYLEKLISHIRSDMKHPMNSQDHLKWLSDPGELISRFNDFYDACFNLNILIPLKGEFFVNAIYFVLVKKEIKNDDLYERIIRLNIDVKIRLIHLLCDGFENKVDENSPILKQFLKLYSKRNDTIHGNFRPKQQKYNKMYLDGNIPLFKNNEPPLVELFSKHLKGIEPSNILENLENVRKFQEVILAPLNEFVREKLLRVLNKSELAWNENYNQLEIPICSVEGYQRTSCEVYRDWVDDEYGILF